MSADGPTFTPWARKEGDGPWVRLPDAPAWYKPGQAPVYGALPPKDVGIAYLLWLLLGLVGGHKFYLGRPLMGVVYALTGGLLLVGVFFDLFTLPSQVRRVNERRARGLQR